MSAMNSRSTVDMPSATISSFALVDEHERSPALHGELLRFALGPGDAFAFVPASPAVRWVF
jgi:hypothetical protein